MRSDHENTIYFMAIIRCLCFNKYCSNAGNESVYQVDARVLAPPEQMPQLQNELHRALQRALPELENGHFSILKVEAQRDEHGTVIAYKVSVRH